ncbi:hypothetical protein DAPPUDRAFT_310125 [Daphnia pulex]|uniref:Uncharacterized protein n=1 Tax=Daphnia pulex TaxID=6669 RepID=E9FSI4_DAPPU|nr:hypothetical protein DAPPUDRAFT_310125 [Daphnia pulex]|eukprot:EFX89826.1 hypothetical protein DAPPUDRAFT_310125 [Daphnia pulex]
MDVLRVIKASAAVQATAVAQLAKTNEEKLVLFFKGEFLAAMQNICRGGHKIRIRWLFQEDPTNPKKKTKNTIAAEKAKDES